MSTPWTEKSSKTSSLTRLGDILQDMSKVFFTVFPDQVTEMASCHIAHGKPFGVNIHHLKGKNGSFFIKYKGISGHD